MGLSLSDEIVIVGSLKKHNKIVFDNLTLSWCFSLYNQSFLHSFSSHLLLNCPSIGTLVSFVSTSYISGAVRFVGRMVFSGIDVG